MAKRVSVISDETLLSEAGLQGLSKRTPLLPQQVTLLTGLSVAALKERRRTKPPKPPLPMLREKAHGAVWYSFGSVCDYLDEWLPLHAEAEALHAKRLARAETQAMGGSPHGSMQRIIKPSAGRAQSSVLTSVLWMPGPPSVAKSPWAVWTPFVGSPSLTT